MAEGGASRHLRVHCEPIRFDEQENHGKLCVPWLDLLNEQKLSPRSVLRETAKRCSAGSLKPGWTSFGSTFRIVPLSKTNRWNTDLERLKTNCASSTVSYGMYAHI